MADNTIANAIKFLKGEEKSLPATKTEGQVYFAYKNVGTAEKPSYTGAIYIDTPIGGIQNRIKMTANADIADKAFNDSAGLSIRDTYLSNLGYTDDGKQIILIKGSGNNQTRIALPIASTTKSGIVTTDAQSFGGTKTFITINSTNLAVTGSGGFSYTGIETATSNKARPVWFAYDGINGKPVVNDNFTYNPATQTLKVLNLSGTAEKANKDSAGNDIRNTYINNITVNGTTLTFTKGNGVTSNITLQDTNNKVTQTAVKSNEYTNWYTILWGTSNGATEEFVPTTVTNSAFTSDTLIFQPSSGTLKAKIFKGNLSGNATTATSASKLNTNAGSATKPVYFSNGVPVACSYTLGKSVPADAIFTDHIYGNMKGATSSTAGSAGLVPAPNAGEQLKFLRADGTWVIPTNTTYSVGTPTYLGTTKLYTTTGSAIDGTMTQNAITVALNEKAPTGHTHLYAGSSSAGGAATSAIKLFTPRKIGKASFDGTSDITLAQMGVYNPIEITKAEYENLRKNNKIDMSAYYNIIDDYDSIDIINDEYISSNQVFSSLKVNSVYSKKSILYNITLESQKWVKKNNKYQYILSVNEITEENIIEVNYSSNATADEINVYQKAGLTDGGQSKGQGILLADILPAIDIPITVIIRNDL